MERTSVNSSHIKSLGWNNNVLEVEFHDGDIYHYHGVSANKHRALMAEAERPGGSVGSHFHRNIRNKHSFAKVSK